VLRALGGLLQAPGFEFFDMDGLRAGFASRQVAVAKGRAPALAGNGLELVASQAIYRTDAVVRRAAALQAHPLTVGPRIVLHPRDAQAAGLAADAVAKVTSDVGTATLPVALSDKVAPGSAWIESGYGATAPLATARVEVRGA
jgi:NADH-quinone oxidoreductase subunit G